MPQLVLHSINVTSIIRSTFHTNDWLCIVRCKHTRRESYTYISKCSNYTKITTRQLYGTGFSTFFDIKKTVLTSLNSKSPAGTKSRDDRRRPNLETSFTNIKVLITSRENNEVTIVIVSLLASSRCNFYLVIVMAYCSDLVLK